MHLLRLRNRLRAGLEQMPVEVVFNGDVSERALPTVLNVRFPQIRDSMALVMRLDIEGIAVSAGSACSSGAQMQSHVLQALGVPTDQASVRFSLSVLNTEEEIDWVVRTMRRVLPELAES